MNYLMTHDGSTYSYEVVYIYGDLITLRETGIRTVTMDISEVYEVIFEEGKPLLPVLVKPNANIGDLLLVYGIGQHEEGRVEETVTRNYLGEFRSTNIVRLWLVRDVWRVVLYSDKETGLLCEMQWFISGGLDKRLLLQTTTIPEFSNIIPMLLLISVLSLVICFKRKRRLVVVASRK